MTEPEGWNQLSTPRRARSSDKSSAKKSSAPKTGIGNGLVETSFTKLAKVHALSIIGDGAVAVALAGSIFFSIDPAAARLNVMLYLVLTIAPFAIVTPLLGPAIDRAAGGRRGMIIGSLVLRMVIALLMARHIDSLLLFPEAFAMLVLQKAYGVSRAALVPAVCPREDELIEANSKLSLLSSIGGLVGGALGVALIAIFNNSASTILAAIVFGFGVVAALKLPQVQIAAAPVDETEKLEVRGTNIILAATAIAVLKGVVGFTTFLLAFNLRSGTEGLELAERGSLFGAAVGRLRDESYEPSIITDIIGPPQWHLGAAGLAAGLGVFLGAKFAPQIRNQTTEERIVLGALITAATAAFLAGWGGGVQGVVVLAFGVGISTSVGKLGFDALVQRDAPRSNHGRAFAQFEGRFQLTWAIGAFIAVVSRFPIQPSSFMIAFAATFAAGSYELGRRSKKAQASARVREAILDRVPQSAVDRIESAKAVQTVKPVFNRVARVGRSLFSVGASSVTAPVNEREQPAPTPSRPTSSTAVPIDSTEVMPTAPADPTAASTTGSLTSAAAPPISPPESTMPPPPVAVPDQAGEVPQPSVASAEETGDHDVDLKSSVTQDLDLSATAQPSHSEDAKHRASTIIEQQRWGNSARGGRNEDDVLPTPDANSDADDGDGGQFRLWD